MKGQSMKKGFKRLIFLILSTCVVLTLLTGAAYAKEANTPSAEVTESDRQAEKDGFFDSVYKVITENLEEILSFLSFVGTLIVAFMYKRGLAPSITKVTGVIGTALEEIGNESKKTGEEATQLSAKLLKISDSVKELSERLALISERLDVPDTEKEITRSVIEGQIDLLYDIFMSSSLPQYKKDEVGERVSKMKESLKQNEKTA